MIIERCHYFAEGLKYFLLKNNEENSIVITNSIIDAIESIKCSEDKIDIIVINFEITKFDNIIKFIKYYRDTAKLVITGIEDCSYYSDFIVFSGANGIVSSKEDIINTVKYVYDVANGSIDLQKECIHNLVLPDVDKKILSKMELKVIKLLMLRKSYKEIGSILKIKTSTVGTYVSRLKEKYKVQTTHDLINLFHKFGNINY